MILHPPSQIVVRYMLDQEESLVGAPEQQDLWPCFISSMPDMPNNCVAVYDTGGEKRGRLLGTGALSLSYGLQIKVRAGTYTEGWQKAQAIEALMSAVKLADVTIEDASYVIENVAQTSPVLPLGPEQGTSRRELFVLNFLVDLTEA